MMSVAEADALLAEHALLFLTEDCPLTAATGKVLREAVVADRDFPPFNRVMMDGIAVHSAALKQGTVRFKLVGVQVAGHAPLNLPDEHSAIEIMTGAVLPEGADTVIKLEDLTIETDGGARYATLNAGAAFPDKAFQHVHLQGIDRKAGDLLVKAGCVLTAAEIALAATVGKSSLQVSRLPRIAVVSTGDELVGIEETPLPHQIRRSNSYAVHALLSEQGFSAELFHCGDDRTELETLLQSVLAESDVVIISGGVSMGAMDTVPAALESVGVKKVFHKIAQRPGKPLWFGIVREEKSPTEKTRTDNTVTSRVMMSKVMMSKAVFALPGNPVSVVVCLLRYALPWLYRSLGITAPRKLYARLSCGVSFAPALTYFVPVSLSCSPDGTLDAAPSAGHGSGDFANLAACDAFLELPADKIFFPKGEAFPVVAYRSLT